MRRRIVERGDICSATILYVKTAPVGNAPQRPRSATGATMEQKPSKGVYINAHATIGRSRLPRLFPWPKDS